MAYPGSRPHTWIAGERVDDTVINEWGPKNVAWGMVLAPVVTAATTAINFSTAIQDIAGMTMSPTLRNDRRYRISAAVFFHQTQNCAGGTPEIQLSITDNANVGLGDIPTWVEVPATTSQGSKSLRAETFFTPAANGVQVIKGRIFHAPIGTASAGAEVLTGSQRLYVEDMGPVTL